LDPGAAPAETATALVAEMETLHGPTEVGIRDQHRVVRVVEEDPLDPAGDLDLTADSVVLLTGGARGITGRMAVEFARRFQCRLELVGRTPEPAGEPDADLADAGDAMAVRTALIARGMSDPGAIERACRRTLAEREIRETLRAIRDAGGTVTYHAVDVRDAEAFGALIDGVYDAYGRLDGIVHGAGILDDKLAKDKEIAAFDRVFGTKVDGALTITRHVRSDIRFIAFFGSVSGVFGNRGQSDYAAANALLDTLARRLDRQLDGRVVSLDWGPWAGGGMVSPELEREYARQGVGLIPPAEGIAALFDEIASGTEAQAVWMCATPEAMSPPAAQRALAPARSAV
ncbi:MAG: SDR family NAD(P)-dependent oxidoreductase, partial [Bacteroidota bacterium]